MTLAAIADGRQPPSQPARAMIPGRLGDRREDEELERLRWMPGAAEEAQYVVEGRRRREEQRLRIASHEARVVTGRRPRLAEEVAGDDHAVELDRMIMLPERPVAGEVGPAPAGHPGGPAVEQAQGDDQDPGDGQPPSPSRSADGRGGFASDGSRRRGRRRGQTGMLGETGSRRRDAARRIRTCNQGIRGPPRFHGARTISPSPARFLEASGGGRALEGGGYCWDSPR